VTKYGKPTLMEEEMATDREFLIWAGMQISNELTGDKRRVFLRALRDNMDAACKAYALDIEQLSQLYVFTELKPVAIAAEGNEDIVTSVTRQVFTYLRDELVKEEVAAL